MALTVGEITVVASVGPHLLATCHCLLWKLWQIETINMLFAVRTCAHSLPFRDWPGADGIWVKINFGWTPFKSFPSSSQLTFVLWLRRCAALRDNADFDFSVPIIYRQRTSLEAASKLSLLNVSCLRNALVQPYHTSADPMHIFLIDSTAWHSTIVEDRCMYGTAVVRPNGGVQLKLHVSCIYKYLSPFGSDRWWISKRYVFRMWETGP
jgi:hypothetical protein